MVSSHAAFLASRVGERRKGKDCRSFWMGKGRGRVLPVAKGSPCYEQDEGAARGRKGNKTAITLHLMNKKKEGHPAALLPSHRGAREKKKEKRSIFPPEAGRKGRLARSREKKGGEGPLSFCLI